jgi:hypothetical protein
MESFATMRKIRKNSHGRGIGRPRKPSRVSACPQFPLKRFDEVLRIWKATTKRHKTFEHEASCFTKGEGAVANIIIISLDDEDRCSESSYR